MSTVAGKKILVVGSYRTHADRKHNRPYTGDRGKQLQSIFSAAGYDIKEMRLTTLIKEEASVGYPVLGVYDNATGKANKLEKFNELYIREELVKGLDSLEKLMNEYMPDIIITLGDYPFWAFFPELCPLRAYKRFGKNYKLPSASRFYGSQLEWNGIRVLPTDDIDSLYVDPTRQRYMILDLRMRLGKAINGEWKEPLRNFYYDMTFPQYIRHLEGIYEMLEDSPESVELGVDIETKNYHISCIGIAWDTESAICVPVTDITDTDAIQHFWSAEEEQALLLLTGKILTHPRAVIIGQNFGYDIQYFFAQLFIRCNYNGDTMLAQHVMYPGTPVGLDTLSRMYCSHHVYWKEDGKVAGKTGDQREHWDYNCRDCVKTLEIWKIQKALLQRTNKVPQFTVQMARVRTLLGNNGSSGAIMLRGFNISKVRRDRERQIMLGRIAAQADLLESLLPPEMKGFPGKSPVPWYKSPHKTAHLFYRNIGVKSIRDKMTQSETTDEKALNTIKTRHPALSFLVTALLEYRSLLKSNEVLNMKLDPDGRVRTSLSPTTETFRYRSSANVFGGGTNLQNISKGAEDD